MGGVNLRLLRVGARCKGLGTPALKSLDHTPFGMPAASAICLYSLAKDLWVYGRPAFPPASVHILKPC